MVWFRRGVLVEDCLGGLVVRIGCGAVLWSREREEGESVLGF
jgi:hypothetical protein